MIEEIQHGHQVFRCNTSHVYERMRMFVPLQNVLEERTRDSKNHLVSLHLLTILTGQSHISEVIVFSQVSKSTFDVFLEVVPLEAKFSDIWMLHSWLPINN